MADIPSPVNLHISQRITEIEEDPIAFWDVELWLRLKKSLIFLIEIVYFNQNLYTIFRLLLTLQIWQVIFVETETWVEIWYIDPIKLLAVDVGLCGNVSTRIYLCDF